MKKHGSNTNIISQAVLRLWTKLLWLRAPLTFLHAISGIKPQNMFPEISALTTWPLRHPLNFVTMLGRYHYSSTTYTDHWLKFFTKLANNFLDDEFKLHLFLTLVDLIGTWRCNRDELTERKLWLAAIKWIRYVRVLSLLHPEWSSTSGCAKCGGWKGALQALFMARHHCLIWMKSLELFMPNISGQIHCILISSQMCR